LKNIQITFLKEVVGETNVTTELADMVSYSTDASLHKFRPEAAVWPANTKQIASILQFCNTERIPVTPRGAGTSLAGQSVPIRGGLVMDLCRMNRIKRISPEDRLALVEPGVVYADLEKALVPYGFFFPPDPASSKVSTLGGNVSTNAGGIKGAKYGTTKDYVLGLQIVLADGRVMRTGSYTMKTTSGYNLTQLFVGSEGTLGIFTEITLKINPKPLNTSTALAFFDDIQDAGRAVADIVKSAILPSVLEIIDRRTLTAINQNTEMNLPEAAAMLLAEADGYTTEEADFQIDKVIAMFRANSATNVRKARSADEAAALWTARKSSYAVKARLNNNLLVEDLTVPISKLPDMLLFVEQTARKHQVLIATSAHAGDGNLHPTICFDGTDKEEVKRVHRASLELFEMAIQMKGTLTGEHGIGIEKANFMSLEHDSVALESMRRLKKLFDPNNIINPGKMALENCDDC
jgi:glycolate oxidase